MVSRGAVQLFGIYAPKAVDETDVIGIIKERIDRLRKAWIKPSGWKEVIDGQKKYDLCSDFDVHWIKLKCRYVSRALEIALEKIQKQKWQE